MLLKNKHVASRSFVNDSSRLPFAGFMHKDELSGELCQRQMATLQEQVKHYLSLLRRALDLTSVVFLVADPADGGVYIYSSSGERSVLPGPYGASEGVLGCLKLQEQISIAPYSTTSPPIPYYQNEKSPPVGSFYAVKSSLSHPVVDIVICLDRMSKERWLPADVAVIESCVANIRTCLSLNLDNLRLQIEGDVLQRAFDGLRNLNMALSLDDVYRTICQTVQSSINLDFCAIASIEHDSVCLESWTGDCDLSNLPARIPLEETVFYQVAKFRHSFPDNGMFQPSLVDPGSMKFFKQFSAFLVVPCFQVCEPVRHVLIIACRDNRDLTDRYKNLFDLIADQLAIKLDLALSHEQIRNMALEDALTGISNLRAFNTAFNTMYERAQRNADKLSLVACDIDHFKKVNDNYGHPCGDQVLRRVASAIDGEVRTIDLVARTGGEEFRILLEGADQQKAAEVAERIRSKIANLVISWQGRIVKVSMSMGVATFTHPGQDKELLVAQADQALYAAKRGGRNRVCLWTR